MSVCVSSNLTTFEALSATLCEESVQWRTCGMDASEWAHSWLLENSYHRQQAVKGMMRHAYGQYEAIAFGSDETNTLQGQGVDNWGGMSLTMVDAIDTLLLMGMRAEYERAVGWLYQHYKEAHGKDLWVNTFESTIRILGGYVGGWALSAPDSPQRAMLAEMAEDIGVRLVKAFHLGTGEPHLPYSDINLATVGALRESALSLVRSLEPAYMHTSTSCPGQVHHLLRKHYNSDSIGLLAVLLPLVPHGVGDVGLITDNKLGLGARGDSYYEYLLKEWILGGKSDASLLNTWQRSLYKIYHNFNSHAEVGGIGMMLTLSLVSFGLHRSDPKMDHLTCFLPGSLALDYIVRGGHDDGVYSRISETGLAPEITRFDAHGLADDHFSMHNLLRPETVEALWYMWRATGEWLFFAKGVVFGNQGTIEKRAGASLGLSSGMLARLTAIPRWKTSECLEVIRDTNQAIFSLIAAEELSTLHSLVVRKAADVSARERMLLHRQSAVGAEIVKAQQMVQELAARLLVDAQSTLNSTAGKLTKRMEALMSRVTSMLQETRRTASERRQREKADAVVQEELKSLRSRIASYKSAATSAKEECARLKKKMNEMSTITDALRARVSTLKTAAGAAREECIRLKTRLEEARGDAEKASTLQAKLRRKVADLEAQNRMAREEIIEVEHRAAENSLAELTLQIERLTRHLDNLETENRRLRASVDELHRQQEEAASQLNPQLVSTATSPTAGWRCAMDQHSPSPPRPHGGVSLFEASFAESSRGTSAHTLLTASLPYFSQDAAAAIGALIVLTSSEMNASLLSRVASALNRAIVFRLTHRHEGRRSSVEGSVAAPARSIMERAKRRLMHQRLGVDFTRSLQTSIPASASASRYDPIDVLQYAAGAPDARRVALAALSHLHISEDANTFRVRLFTDAGLQEFIATVMAEQCGDPACLSAAVALGTKAVARAAESALGSSDLDLATWEFLLLLTVKFEISTLHGILTVNEDRAKALSSEAATGADAGIEGKKTTVQNEPQLNGVGEPRGQKNMPLDDTTTADVQVQKDCTCITFDRPEYDDLRFGYRE
ncbi:hypothetical protein Pmar_PMAR004847 [Perkinsus marinus ATCC 50983]|uniref:alpha-1,2-Mannosidase n=1 Tax=Perkinsus marinus (strain ATCC 50983 / TXsc) TaxID=423536 RepID=C5LLC5_PERM5|nr:hypothetical protein Pmar_PMAR004847 [Perkinsus marinus ATCC 50983]EER02484.1 hypothetical protein Pmar_PMAR004847 [Perkinsus marinus ATCC 50983]|eukprot:XP_002769766.1 hypothetical protein Pmar_PMAR004847 [Perkinsus marinus ATCC 50983]